MKTLKHKLLSIPDKEIDISEAYAKIADNLIKDLQSLESPEDIIGTLNVYGYAFDNAINTEAHAFFYSKRESPESEKVIDKIYIALGQRALDKDTELGMAKLKEGYQKKKNRLGLRNNIKYGRLYQILEIVEIGSEKEWRRILKEGSKK